MKLHLLPLLACPSSAADPVCGGALEFSALDAEPRAHEEIETGMLRCRVCGREYPIVDAIPRLTPASTGDDRVARTRVSFGFEWHRYPGALPEDQALFLEETQIPAAEWEGRTVLDAGCGMGRYARVALSLGAEVVAFDLSESLTRLVPDALENPKLHIVQGDLLRPPLKRGAFDIVYSQGVIHHTADTRGAFDRIAELVKRDGRLSVWVYGSPGSYASFSTNPLRSARTWLKSALPAAWVIAWIRLILSDLLRVFTTRMPVPLLYLLCFPLTVLGMFPLVKYLTFSVHPKFRVRLIENFDWLAPPFQTKHTKEEVREWFVQAGYEVLSHLPHGFIPKVGLLGKRTKK